MTSLLTLTVNAVSLAVGVRLPGPGVHVTGPPLPQFKITKLEYPLRDVRVPLKVAIPVTPAVWR